VEFAHLVHPVNFKAILNGCIRKRRGLLVALVLSALVPGGASAQGDGPGAQRMIPVGPWVVVPTYIDISSNQNFQQSILINDADINADLYGVSMLHAFDWGGRYAQIWITPLYGRVSGDIEGIDPGTGEIRRISAQKTGWGDPVVSFKLGLIGMSPKDLTEFGREPEQFQLGLFVSATPTLGDYDSGDLLNIGAGRWSLKFGLPMLVPLGSDQKLFWEVHPGITFYQDNDDPTGGAQRREQDPLFKVENHLVYEFSQKLWGSLDLAYQKGGETTTDNIADDNEKDHWGGGLSLGYAVHPAVSLQASYGRILKESDDATGEMFRVKVAVLFP
jgi:hypothetical protein